MRFAGAKNAVERLYSLAHALVDDYERFEQLVDGARAKVDGGGEVVNEMTDALVPVVETVGGRRGRGRGGDVGRGAGGLDDRGRVAAGDRRCGARGRGEVRGVLRANARTRAAPILAWVDSDRISAFRRRIAGVEGGRRGEGSWLGTVDTSGAREAAVPARLQRDRAGTWSDSSASRRPASATPRSTCSRRSTSGAARETAPLPGPRPCLRERRGGAVGGSTPVSRTCGGQVRPRCPPWIG